MLVTISCTVTLITTFSVTKKLKKSWKKAELSWGNTNTICGTWWPLSRWEFLFPSNQQPVLTFATWSLLIIFHWWQNSLFFGLFAPLSASLARSSEHELDTKIYQRIEGVYNTFYLGICTYMNHFFMLCSTRIVSCVGCLLGPFST